MSLYEARRRQAGRFNIVTVIVLLGVAVGAYSAIRFIPIYIEKSRISRLVKQAANEWVNVEPNLEKVKKDLQEQLEISQVHDITAEDVQFARASDDEVEAWVNYQVTVKHPYDIVKPTRLKFKIDHVTKRTFSN